MSIYEEPPRFPSCLVTATTINEPWIGICTVMIHYFLALNATAEHFANASVRQNAGDVQKVQ